MAQPTADIALLDYVRIVSRRRWVLVVAVSAAIFGSLLISVARQPVYQAEAQMLVEPRSGQAVFTQDPTLNVQNLERAIRTEIQVLEGSAVRERVQADLGLPDLPPEVSASPVGSTDVVAVRVRSGDPDVARVLADSYIAAYTQTRQDQARAELRAAEAELDAAIQDLQRRIDSAPADQRTTLIDQQATFRERLDQLRIEAALTTGGASVVKPADLPTDPIEPTPVRSALVAGAFGLLLGLGAAFLLEHLDDSLKSQEDVEDLTDLPVLAVVPVESPPDYRPIALSEPHEPAVEIYRGLRTNVQFLGLDRLIRIIQVTSSLPGEGKTTTAANLAVVLAQAGSRVALVDADLRNPRIHEVFNVSAAPGLTEVLLGDLPDLVIHRVDDHLRVITAGTVPPNPSELMSHPRIGKFVTELANRYDYVIVDTAPVLPVADALSLSRVVHGVLVVAQANRVSKKELGETLSRLQRVTAPVFGVVLNRATRGASTGTYGYGYNYADGEEPTPAARTQPDPGEQPVVRARRP